MIELDCLGMACPTPIIKINKAMKEMEPGEQLRVKADDPAFRVDVEAWSNKTGNPLISFKKNEDVQTAILEKEI